jgi:hypothetical protein
MEDYLHPVTIVSDRYRGAYSGAKFLAFNTYYCNVPDAIGSGDSDEMIFWEGEEHKKWDIGMGETPEAAYFSLMRIVRMKGEV